VSLQLPQKFAKKSQHNQTHPPPATLCQTVHHIHTTIYHQSVPGNPKPSKNLEQITLPLKSKVTGCIIAIADDFVPS
jgi:hypothetical protein